MDLNQARFFMVEQQIRPWDVLDPKILDLLQDTPRHLFVEAEQQELAYSDIELPIGSGQTMMHPRIEARLLQAVDIDSSETVLEIGTGSGYLTALIAKQAKAVHTVELYPELQEKAKKRLHSLNNIQFHTGDGSSNWNDGQTYDVIILTGSVPKIPQAYKEKLSLGGRLCLITGKAPAMQAQMITRVGQQEWETETLFETEISPLITSETTQHIQPFRL